VNHEGACRLQQTAAAAVSVTIDKRKADQKRRNRTFFVKKKNLVHSP